MVDTNYKIESILILLNEDCILQRYYPLVQVKQPLLRFLQEQGVVFKDDCGRISDDKYLANGTLNAQTLQLFKRFLTMYDVKRSKIAQLNKLCLSDEMRQTYEQFFALPGVSETRANLYYKAGLRSLRDVANLTASELVDKCKSAIDSQNLSCIAPLTKEASTHIAVAKAFCVWTG